MLTAMSRSRPLRTRKLLQTTVGVATVTYLGVAGCTWTSGNLMAPVDDYGYGGTGSSSGAGGGSTGGTLAVDGDAGGRAGASGAGGLAPGGCNGGATSEGGQGGEGGSSCS
jgi:hypothetical protein